MTRKIATYKYDSHSLLASDKYRYGDLFGMSYLPEFKIPYTKAAHMPFDKCGTNNKSIDLYAFCDSYIWSYLAEDSFYCNVDSLKIARLNIQARLTGQLDTSKINVLLIESVERGIKSRIGDEFDYLQNLFIADGNNTPQETIAGETGDFLFNKNINTNIEFNVFESSIFSPIKELKAVLNHNLFNRVDDNVVIPPDSKMLLYNKTIDTTDDASSFKYISDLQVDSMVERLNILYFQYKKMGFDKIYFSMLPNPVTVLYPNIKGYHHNNLIERIENNPALKMPLIKVYEELKSSKVPVFCKSDTHWNMDGAFIWLNKFNHILEHLTK